MLQGKSQMTMKSGRRKLPARYAAIVSPLVLSLLMTFIVSFISTLKKPWASARPAGNLADRPGPVPAGGVSDNAACAAGGAPHRRLAVRVRASRKRPEMSRTFQRRPPSRTNASYQRPLRRFQA